MNDLISRQAVLDIVDDLRDRMTVEGYCAMTERVKALKEPGDLISRQALMKEFSDFVRASNNSDFARTPTWNDAVSLVGSMPSAQPTLYGYDIEHLELIARVLQKEDLPPERLVEALTDIGRIVAIVKDDYEEALRKAVEQCKI